MSWVNKNLHRNPGKEPSEGVFDHMSRDRIARANESTCVVATLCRPSQLSPWRGTTPIIHLCRDVLLAAVLYAPRSPLPFLARHLKPPLRLCSSNYSFLQLISFFFLPPLSGNCPLGLITAERLGSPAVSQNKTMESLKTFGVVITVLVKIYSGVFKLEISLDAFL